MPDYWSMDVKTLTALQKAEEKKLIQQLLSGTEWEETADQRDKVREISVVLYKKINPDCFTNPAEGSLRNH